MYASWITFYIDMFVQSMKFIKENLCEITTTAFLRVILQGIRALSLERCQASLERESTQLWIKIYIKD